MRFRFDANQEYQIRAIEAVADLFEGQIPAGVEPPAALGAAFLAVSNRLDLDDTALLLNLRAVQARNGILRDEALQCIEGAIETADGPRTARFTNFSVEAETGTGKTYIYLRTALELARRYGMRKFVIVVPSIAVREGVLKTLSQTETHFRELYGNAPYRYYVYDSANISQVRQFALSDSVEFMIMTIDAFNKAAKNVIHQTTDRLQGERPIHLVQAARPILILDEPQNMESEISVAALAALDPLFALRYSATHRNPYNLVYRLTPYDAYRQGLVKRIEVASVRKENDFNAAYVRLLDMTAVKHTITARLAVHVLMKDGTVKEKTVTVRPGDDLRAKTNRPEYAGFVVDEINLAAGFLRFANDIEITPEEAHGADKEAVFEAQIRYAIEEHFRKQRRLKPSGIKVLSLYFIDRVDNYARQDGILRRLFNQAFNDLKARYEEWCDTDPETVQAAYFAQRRTKVGEVLYEDSTTGAAKKDEDAYDLIMRDKERLLSLEEPVAFIFSHSALREGWDNPNVFQICTLNQTTSEIKKRQEVGRGVRLAVNQDGQRVREERINVLTVIANESYEEYCARLQTEIEEEYGKEGLPPKPANARDPGVARLRRAYTLRPEFKELWERIKHKTRYAVTIDSQALIAAVVADLDQQTIAPPRVTVTRAQITTDGDTLTAIQTTAPRTALTLSGRDAAPDVIAMMEHLLDYTTPPVHLSRRTLIEILRRTRLKPAALVNPHEFATLAARAIKSRLADQLVNGIQYERINEWYEMERFDAEIPWSKEDLVPAERSLYDHIPCDSEIEKQFARDLDKKGFVKLFVKLPSWFTVPTPIGEYNPDWAIVLEETDEHGEATGKPLLYLVRETKATTNPDELPPDERRKVHCGKRHFEDALGVDYRVVVTADQLP